MERHRKTLKSPRIEPAHTAGAETPQPRQARGRYSLTNNVGVGGGTIIHNRTTIRGPVIIGEHCEIGPDTYIGPYTSIGDHATIRNTEIENSIIMEGTNIDCGRRITDSLIGRNVTILSSEQNLPKGHKLILGDMTTVTL